MKYYLYYLTDENDKVHYVGITTNVKRRMNSHKKDKPPHTFELIEHFDNPEDAGLAEQNHIMRHDTLDNGWNKTIGGDRLLSGKDHPSYIDGRCCDDKKEYIKKYHQQNRDKILQYKRKYNRKNKDIINQKTNQRYYKRKYPCVCLFTGMVY